MIRMAVSVNSGRPSAIFSSPCHAMSEDKITQALSRLFEKHRIVFWYDAKQEFSHDYSALNLAGNREDHAGQ